MSNKWDNDNYTADTMDCTYFTIMTAISSINSNTLSETDQDSKGPDEDTTQVPDEEQQVTDDETKQEPEEE
jgi:hypothetical protein